MMNGRETNQLYLGDYYVQELVAPVDSRWIPRNIPFD